VGIDDLPARYEVRETVRAHTRRTLVRAYDRQLGREMALKLFALDDDTPRDELVEEARMLLTLDSHPGLPTMRGDFFVADTYVIVMDWIDGVDLATVLERRGAPGLTYATVVEYVNQAASALDHLHHNDPPIVHGDIKPANLVVTNLGKVVLVDLGLARESGSVREAGSRGFMAPEVIAGEPCTPAADVYGLAATAVALLTGGPPGFEPPDFGDLDPTEAAPLRRALARGLAFDAAARPASAGELADRVRSGHRVLPSGVVTFLALEVLDADMWDTDPEVMQSISDALDDLVAAEVEVSGGRMIASESATSMRAVFPHATAAVTTALALQRRVAEAPGPRGSQVQLRMAIHTGESEARNGSYTGPVPVRVGRLRDHAPAGGTVVSTATAELVRHHLPEGVRLVELARDGTGDLFYGLVVGGDIAVDDVAVAEANSRAAPEPVSTVAAPPAPSGGNDQSARLDRAVRNALELAEHARRSGDADAAARFEATAQELAEQLVALERERAE
jgi:class 3 adenylate cyclase